MPPAASANIVESSGASNRRQPVRQTRTHPPKYAFSGGRALMGRGSLSGAAEERPQSHAEPAFLPGLEYFTGAISALPKEMSRNFTMLKEVDAKIYHPEENLTKLVKNISSAPVPMPFTEASKIMEFQSQVNSGQNSAAASVNGAASVAMAPRPSQMSLLSQATSIDNYDIPRRRDFLNMRILMTDMLPILEEKNHVIATATDTLAKQLARCESAWPEIEKEISEETRLGNLHHWAYTDRAAEKKDARAERPRREAAVHNAFAAVADDFGAVRGTGKRRAQQAQIESEIDETRAKGRGLGSGKAKKPVPNQATAVGLGLSSGVTNQSKKRKVDEGIAGAADLPKSLASIMGKGAGSKRAASPRSSSPATKRSRVPGNPLGVNGKGRARAGTGASAVNSPLVSSPVVGTFAASQKPNASPALGPPPMGRTASSRGRQNSTQNHSAGPTSAPKQTNGISKQNEEETPAVPKSANRTPRIENTVEDSSEPRSAVKREESSSRQRPPSIATGTRASGKASKNATPISASFAEAASSNSRPRSNRAGGVSEPSSKSGGAGSPALGGPPKRSHKKGAGLAAQQAAQARAQARAESESHGDGDGGEEEQDADDGEKRYCYCNGVSYGDMVGCDGDGCEKEWFHLGCIGLEKIPSGKAKWYCRDCKRRNNIT